MEVCVVSWTYVLGTPVYNKLEIFVLALCFPQIIRFIRRMRDMDLAPLGTEKMSQSLPTMAMYMRMVMVMLVRRRRRIDTE
jgi:hypothetical protein